MIEIAYIVCFVISLGSIAMVVLVMHQLQGDYKSEFLNNYFYYLIAFLAFGFYATWAQIFLRYMMLGLELSPQVLDRIGTLLPVLGFPFIVIAWLMQIRMMYGIRSQKMKSIYALLYFVILLMVFAGLNIIWRFTGYELSFTRDIRVLVISIIIGSDVFIWLITIWIGIVSLKQVQHGRQKSIYSRFIGLLVISLIVRYSLCPIMFMHPLLLAVFLLFFFVSFIIPLIYLTKNADDLFPQEILQIKETIDMDSFFSKFQISRREAEIVEQICLGKSNKQIAEELFISLQTVKDHTHRIYTKIGINSRMQLLQRVQGGR